MTLNTPANKIAEGHQDFSQVAGQYLTFTLNNEIYGLRILKVQEIIGMQTVTRVPKTPHFIRGVINLRGKVLPVIELRAKFGMEGREDTERTCIIVIQVIGGDMNVTMGVIVDEVSEVVEIEASRIEPAPTFGSASSTDFILGMGKIGQRVVMLLDVDRVLSVGEMGGLSGFDSPM